MKEVIMQFSDAEFDKLDEMSGPFCSIQELLFDCLIGILPWLDKRPYFVVDEGEEDEQ